MTVNHDPAWRYWVSFTGEEGVEPLPLPGRANGFDLGIKAVVVGSDGWRSGNPEHWRAWLRHLKCPPRRLSRMQKGSHRRARQKARVARIHARIAAARADFLHKVTPADDLPK